MSYLFDREDAEAMEANGTARPAPLTREPDTWWARQCEKRVEFRKPFIWHGNSEAARRAAGKESVI